MKKTVGTLAIAFVAAAGTATIVAATPAAAGLTTQCVGEGGAVTVPGDLVVPANKSCTLTGTTIDGNVRVAKGADLILDGVTVNGRVVVAADGYLEAADSTVGADVALNGAYGAYLETSTVTTNVRSTTPADAAAGALVYLGDSEVGRHLRSTGDELFVENSTIVGNVDSTDSLYTDLYESFVDGNVTVAGSELGSVFCGTAVQKAASFADNAGTLQLGADGPAADCALGAYWGADLSASGNTGGVYVDSSIVRGNVAFDANDPVAQLGADNVVRGEVTGDYEDWDGAAVAAKSSRMSVQAAPEARAKTFEKKIDQRRAAAEASAAKAGEAVLG